MDKKKDRVIGLDIVRSCAVFFVLSTHFFFNDGYYQASLAGKKMFLMTVMRWLFYTCVPLFLILTGFLEKNKKLEWTYYKKINRVLFEYLAACILCNLFKVFYLHQRITAGGWIGSIFDFSAEPYSWYINMYLGLFLIIPFLNIMYHGINRGRKKLLISTMLFLTAVPTFFNTVMPCIFNIKIELFPNWWTTLYPVSYYFIGAYIAEYKTTFKKQMTMIGIISILFIQAFLSFLISKGGIFNWDAPGGFGTLSVVATSVCIFLLLYQINLSNKFLLKLISSISSCSLSIYLLSWIFDQLVYKILNSHFTTVQDKIPYYFAVVPCVFVLSYCSAFIINLSYKYFLKLCSCIKSKSNISFYNTKA